MSELHVPPSELGIDLTDINQFFKWTQVLAWAKKREQDAMEENNKTHGKSSGPKLEFDYIDELIKKCPQPPPKETS